MPSSGDTSSSISSYAESQLHTAMRVNISPARKQNKNSMISTSKAQSSSNLRTTTKLGSALDILAKFDKKYKSKPVELSNAPISANNFADDRNLTKTVAYTPNTSNTSMQSAEESVLSTNDKSSFRDSEIPQVSDIKSKSTRASVPSKSSSKLSLNEETELNYESDFENSDCDESIVSTSDVDSEGSIQNIAEHENKSQNFSGQPLLTRGSDGGERNKQSGKIFSTKHETLKSLSEVRLSSATKSMPRSLETDEFNNDIFSDEEIISDEEHFQKIILSFDDLSLKRSKIMGNISKEQSNVRDQANEDVKPVSEHDSETVKRKVSTSTVGSLKDLQDVEDAESYRSADSWRKRRHRRRMIITKTERDDCERREKAETRIQQPQFNVLKLNWDIRANDEGYLKDSSEILETSPEIVEALLMQQPLESAFNKLLLKQVRLTSRFMSSQYEMYLRCSETVQSVARHYQPITLETTKQFIKTHRQSRGQSKVTVP